MSSAGWSSGAPNLWARSSNLHRHLRKLLADLETIDNALAIFVAILAVVMVLGLGYRRYGDCRRASR
jgi:hypothetical protein